MEAGATTLKKLFKDGQTYVIPVFQRPYVWSQDEQWEPLWADVEALCRRALEVSRTGRNAPPIGTHYLGAVVTKSLAAVPGGGVRYSVIDGQQRIATLQLFMHAAATELRDLGRPAEYERLAASVADGSKFDSLDALKLYPSRIDRAGFEAAMTSNPAPGIESQVVRAHEYFRAQARSWLLADDDPDTDVHEGLDDRAIVLADSLLDRLVLVAIALDHTDDDQLIFETLNDRGTPLLAADLVKNQVFQWGEELGANTERWANSLWLEFDDAWWRDEIKQGRLFRSRIDIFLQYWLTMRTRQEVQSDQVFREFRVHAAASFEAIGTAQDFLHALLRDADTFRRLAEMDKASAVGRFYHRVIESLELAATTPLLLWLLSSNHHVPEDQVEIGLGAVESWVVRRTMLKMTMKNVNLVMVAMLAALDGVPVEEAGGGIRDFLAGQVADSRLWPDDESVIGALPWVSLYGNVRQSRIRVVLEGIEHSLRTSMHDPVSIPSGLDVEHIMPRSWAQFWNTDPPLDPVAAAHRDRRVNYLGNLTLLNRRLNASLSNRPWRDDEVVDAVSRQGDHSGLGKKSLLAKYSGLIITREVLEQHPDHWTDDAIIERGERLARQLCVVWPR
jgi:hypothetical protein